MTEPPSLRPFDARPMLAALEQHRVDYVLIGGFAAQQHGAMRRTEDIDVTPATDLDNPSTRPGSPDTPTSPAVAPSATLTASPLRWPRSRTSSDPKLRRVDAKTNKRCPSSASSPPRETRLARRSIRATGRRLISDSGGASPANTQKESPSVLSRGRRPPSR